MAVDLSPTLPTRDMLAQMLILFRRGERVRVIIDPREADNLIAKLRVAKSRGLKRVAASGARRKHFFLRCAKTPYSRPNQPRMVAVYFWEGVTEGQAMAQEMERLLSE